MAKTHPELSELITADIAFESADFAGSSFSGWLHERMQINLDKRLLQVDLDMLLEPFESRPGKQWWAGEHIGKFLHAASYSWRFTGREDLKERMDLAASRLIATQLADGYLGTYAENDRFAEGDGLGWDAPVWDVWTHKYCLIGLLSYYQATAECSALDACIKAADLMHQTFVVGKRPMRLASSHMGMAATSVLEPIAILYQLTGEPRYLEFCHYLVDSWEDEDNPNTWRYEDGSQILNSLLEHGSVHKTANRKAYEMLSNLIGLLEMYRFASDPRFLTACINAWRDIVTKRRYITGTASYFEQFTPDHRLPPGEAVGEGCVTVTWLQLNLHLLQLTGNVEYADELERTIYNALPAAQSPHTGKVAYFVPLVGKRHFGSHDKGTPQISCCTSSIPRGLAMIPAFAAGMLDGKPALLQYIPGKHVIRDDFVLRLRGDYPQGGELKIEVETTQAGQQTLVLRVPEWADGFAAEVDGKVYKPEKSRWLEIDRQWSAGDVVKVSIPLSLRIVEDGDKTTNSVAFMRGPQVLATDTAIDANNGKPPADWWGDDVVTWRTLYLTSFADAGQHMEEYAALQECVDATEGTSG